MKLIISLISLTFFSLPSFAAPKYVDCTNASTPLVDKGTGPQGFGITYDFPEKMVVVKDFVYSKVDEKAWMEVIVDGTVYRPIADCRLKINRGVLCQFDLTMQATGSWKNPADGNPLTDYMTRLNASVVDTDLENDLVRVGFGMDDQSTVPSHPMPYGNMIQFDNDWIGNCKSLEVLEQG